MAGRGTPKTVDELLTEARAMLSHRPTPAEALHAQANGALLVDIRGDDQRRDGLIHATDLDGGFAAWAAAGLPVIPRSQPA